MCLTRVGRNKVAKEDIIVYKLLKKKINCSPFQGMEYEADRVYRAKLGRADSYWDKPEIYEGLHAYLGKCSRMIAQKDRTECKVVKMTIPAGTKYALGRAGDIVAECLVTGDLKAIRGRDIPKTKVYSWGQWSYDI